MDESQGFSDRAKGDRAKDLLNNPVFQDALQAVRESIFRSWESLPTTADDQLKELKLSIHLLNAIERNLETFIETGELDKFRTEQENKLKDNKKWQ
jgi:hypothetical protein